MTRPPRNRLPRWRNWIGDPVRIRIDDALCTVLELPSLAPVRALLAREPGLTGQKIGP